MGKIDFVPVKMDVVDVYNDDGWKSWKEIQYSCPTCGRKLKGYKCDTACDQCGTFYAWPENKPRIVTTHSIQ